MHLRFIAEGWDKDLDYMEKWIGQMILPMKVKDKKGKEVIVGCPCYLRPFRMYDLIFPKDQLDVILNTIKPVDEISLVDGKGTKKFKTQISILRKLMKLKKIPKSNKDKGQVAIPEGLFQNIRTVGLGIKEDVDYTNESGVTQEAL
jgi:hypothetical protein